MAATHSNQFRHELEEFRKEAEQAIQYFYAYITVHAVARERTKVWEFLNKAPLYWNTSLAAMQTATFITLGRIFDQGSPHNVDRLLGLANRHQTIFSKVELGLRKQGASTVPPPWLAEYLAEAYVPDATDFRRLRAHVKKWRRVYEANYRDLRHKVFAHRELTDGAAISALFGKTNIRELQRMLVFLSALYEALWQLLENGHKPLLRPRRYSAKRMRDKPSPGLRQAALQERITRETEQLLISSADLK